MKTKLLIVGFFLASCFCVKAENFYSVPLSNDIVPLGLISLAATITGRVSSASSIHRISFQVDKDYESQTAAIYTNTGTGAVFRARLYVGEEGAVDISSVKGMSFNDSTPYVLEISASTYKQGANYAVRIGTFGDFSVSFNGNGGTASQTNKVYALGKPYGSFPNATRTGYTHTGWSTAAKNGIVVSTNTAVCLGYKTLYAQWKEDPVSPLTPTNDTPAVTNYWVKFDSNGGSGTMSNQVFTVDVEQALATNVFTRSGYDFRGWAKSATGNVVYEDGAVVTNLTNAGSTNTLYASWIISSEQISTEEVDGVTWHYTATNGVATIQNVLGGSYVSAVDTSISGTLTIPETLGSNTVEVIGERAFADCGAITSIVMPFGVTTIGSYAFAGCKSLSPGITIPESVDTMGSCAFADCVSLKIVRYFGDRPDADDDLYAGAPASLVSGVLRVRSGWELQEDEPVEVDASDDNASADTDGGADAGTDADVGDGGDDSSSAIVWHESLPASWPEGAYSRRALWLTDQPLNKVVFWGVPGINKTATIQYYIPGRVVGSLPDAPDDRDGYTFLGWFTKPYGGVEVTNEISDEMIVNKSFSLYAHWQSDNEPENLSDVEYNLASAHVYDGYLLDGDENVAGTIQLKTSKAKWNRKEEETNVTATATIVLLGEGSIRLKGVLGEDLSGTLSPTKGSDERELEVSLNGSGMEGAFANYTVVGTRYVFGRKTYLDRVKAMEANDNWKGYYVVAFKSGSDESSLGNGYVGLSVQIKTGGKARVTGVMPDGTKVAYTGRIEVFDGYILLPVAVPLNSGKKGGFGFLVSFSDDFGVSVSAVSSWINTSVPFTSVLDVVGAGYVTRISSNAAFSLEDAFGIDNIEIDESLLPMDVAVTVSGARWITPKSDRVKFISDDAAYDVLTEYGNPAGLSLSFKPVQGMFLGRFKVFAVTEAGKSKKYTATVSGAVLDGVGYGTATIKKIGSVPVTVTSE